MLQIEDFNYQSFRKLNLSKIKKLIIRTSKFEDSLLDDMENLEFLFIENDDYQIPDSFPKSLVWLFYPNELEIKIKNLIFNFTTEISKTHYQDLIKQINLSILCQTSNPNSITIESFTDKFYDFERYSKSKFYIANTTLQQYFDEKNVYDQIVDLFSKYSTISYDFFVVSIHKQGNGILFIESIIK